MEQDNGIHGEVLLKLSSAFNHLGKAEQRVANFIRNYPDEVLKLPINILAKKVGVSVSTVIRLCRRIGIEGYSDLKITLARELALSYEKAFPGITADDTISSVLDKSREIFLVTINNTFKMLCTQKLKEAYQEILAARSILIIGTGGSAAVARLFNHKLLKFGLHSQWSNDFTSIPLLINKMDGADLLFAITHSGSTHSIYDAVVMAKEQGCRTITLTNYFQSPAAKESDIVLTTAVQEEPFGSEGGTTRIAQLSVLEVLCFLLAAKGQEVLSPPSLVT